MDSKMMMSLGVAGAVIVGVVAMATNSWATLKVQLPPLPELDMSLGLFKVCTNDTCEDYKNEKSEVKNGRMVTIVLCVLALVLAGIFVALQYVGNFANGMIPMYVMLGAGVMALLAGVLWAVLVKAKNDDDFEKAPIGKKSSFGYSYYLQMVAGLLFVGVGVWAHFSAKKGSKMMAFW